MNRRKFVENLCKTVVVASIVPIALKEEVLSVYYVYPMDVGSSAGPGTVTMRHYQMFDGLHPPISKSKIEVWSGKRVRVFRSPTILRFK